MEAFDLQFTFQGSEVSAVSFPVVFAKAERPERLCKDNLHYATQGSLQPYTKKNIQNNIHKICGG